MRRCVLAKVGCRGQHAAENSEVSSMLSDEELQEIAPFALVPAPGDKVSEIWTELRQRPGVAPVLLGNRDAVGLLLKELNTDPRSPEEVLEQAGKLDVDTWMAERIRSRPEYFDVARMDVPWDGAPRSIPPFIPALDHRGVPYPEVIFGLIPVEVPWLVPTHLRTAAWGDCPDAVVHTAIFRRWYERYGAVVSTIADGVVEIHVERPPATPAAAHELAVELFIYCPDIVCQGVRSIGNLAAAILNGRLWYFWWAFEHHDQ
jgi:hypothetical protein